MTPTNKLRFVRRHIDCDNGLSILQRWWEELCVDEGCPQHGTVHMCGEWRDVPVEDET